MNWNAFAETFDPMTCVLSVEKKPGGGYSTIRIVTGNQKYLDSIALAAGGVDRDSNIRKEFVPNSEYTRYIPKDLNFEEDIYRCAVLKQPKHMCVHMDRYSFDIDLYLMPMGYEEDGYAYCTFSQILINKEDHNLVSTGISRETASSVISTCIKLRSDKPFREIMQEVIEDIREICGAERCCVLLMDENRRACTVLGEAKAPGSSLPSVNRYLNDDFYQLAESWIETMSGSYCLTIREPGDLEYVKQRNPKWYESLVDANVQSLVIYPLESRNKLIGYIWAVDFDASAAAHIKETLQITTYFIAAEIANNQLIEQLKMVSKIDLLTGVMNRNAMNERLASIREADPAANCHMSIVFIDMNGLKYVNDYQGHEAGDLLLKNAAIILQSVFVDDEIYRAGGDEFLVLLNETDTHVLDDKVEEIKKKSDMFDNVSFSVGYSLIDHACDVNCAVAEADARMYEDKQKYYANGGTRR